MKRLYIGLTDRFEINWGMIFFLAANVAIWAAIAAVAWEAYR